MIEAILDFAHDRFGMDAQKIYSCFFSFCYAYFFSLTSFYIPGLIYIVMTVNSKIYLIWIDHFISSLRDEVRILKELPPRLKRRVEMGMVYSMPPISWSDISYYHNQVNSLSLPSLLCT